VKCFYGFSYMFDVYVHCGQITSLQFPSCLLLMTVLIPLSHVTFSSFSNKAEFISLQVHLLFTFPFAFSEFSSFLFFRIISSLETDAELGGRSVNFVCLQMHKRWLLSWNFIMSLEAFVNTYFFIWLVLPNQFVLDILLLPFWLIKLYCRT